METAQITAAEPKRRGRPRKDTTAVKTAPVAETMNFGMIMPKKYVRNPIITDKLPDRSSLHKESKMVDRFMTAIQKEGIALESMIRARTLAGQQVTPRMQFLAAHMQELSDDALKVLEKEILPFLPIWTEYLSKVKGVGFKTAAHLIADIGDIARFPNVSSMLAYFGLIGQYVIGKCSKGHNLIMSSDKNLICQVMEKNPAYVKRETRRRNGEEVLETDPILPVHKCGAPITIIEYVNGNSPKAKAGHNFMFCRKGKTNLWLIAGGMMKANNEFYRKIYDDRKEFELSRGNEKMTKYWAHNRALRKVMTIFMTNVWLNWRVLEGLPVRAPYQFEHLGHQTLLLDPVGQNDLIRQKIQEYMDKQQQAAA